MSLQSGKVKPANQYFSSNLTKCDDTKHIFLNQVLLGAQGRGFEPRGRHRLSPTTLKLKLVFHGPIHACYVQNCVRCGRCKMIMKIMADFTLLFDFGTFTFGNIAHGISKGHQTAHYGPTIGLILERRKFSRP